MMVMTGNEAKKKVRLFSFNDKYGKTLGDIPDN